MSKDTDTAQWDRWSALATVRMDLRESRHSLNSIYSVLTKTTGGLRQFPLGGWEDSMVTNLRVEVEAIEEAIDTAIRVDTPDVTALIHRVERLSNAVDRLDTDVSESIKESA